MADESAPPVETEDEKRAREAEEARVAAAVAYAEQMAAEAEAEAKRIAEQQAAMQAAAEAQAAAAAASEKAEEEARAAALAALKAGAPAPKPVEIPLADEIQAPAGPDGKSRFGPTFADELKAAGCLGLHYGFDAANGTLTFGPDITPADRAKVVAVVEAHDPSKQPVVVFSVAKIDVLRQLSDEDYAALEQKVGTQPPRIQAIYNAAINFVSDSPEYGLLMQMATELYGADRAKQLLMQQGTP